MKIKNIQVEVSGTVCNEVRASAHDIANEALSRVYNVDYDSEDQSYDHLAQVIDGLLTKTFGHRNRSVIDEHISFVPIF